MYRPWAFLLKVIPARKTRLPSLTVPIGLEIVVHHSVEGHFEEIICLSLVRVVLCVQRAALE